MKLTAQTGDVALGVATKKTVVMIIMPTNQRGKLIGWGVSFDGVTAAAEPVTCELFRPTSAGTGTSLTPAKFDDDQAEAIQSTAKHTCTVEPTYGDIIESKLVHPQGGRYDRYFPEDIRPHMKGASRMGIACTAPAAVNVCAYLIYEE